MFKLSEKNNNGIAITFKSLRILKEIPLAIFFVTTIIFLYLAAIIGFLYLEYSLYGIHIFDMSTFWYLTGFSEWQHIGHVIYIILSFMILNFLIFSLKLAFTYTVTQYLKNSPISYTKIIKLPFKSANQLLQLSAIKAFDNLKNIFSIFSFSNHMKRAQELCEGTFETPCTKYECPNAILLLPTLAETDLPILQALKESQDLLSKKFSKNVAPNFSFSDLYHISLFFIIVAVGCPLHFIYGLPLFSTLIICAILYLVSEQLYINTHIIFHGAVYDYCKNGITKIFTPEEFALYFPVTLKKD